MKKFIALVLAMLMVISCACVISAEDKTLFECLGKEAGTLNSEVKTSVVGKLSTFANFTAVVEANGEADRSYDLKAILDMTGVKNLVALAKTKAEGLGYTGDFNALDVKGAFKVVVSYPDGITIPDFAAEGAFTTELADIFTVSAPVVDAEAKTITFDFAIADGTKAEAIDKFADEFSLTAFGFEVTEIGDYVFTGKMTGNTDIYEGENKVYTINYKSVDANDAEADPSLTIRIKEKKSSSSTPNSTTKPSGGSSSGDKKDDKTDNTGKIESTVSGSTATVKDVTADDIDAAAKNNELVIDLTDHKKDIDTVKVSGTTIKNIDESDVENVEINLGDTKIAVDDKTISEIAKADAKNVEIGVNKDVKLNEKQDEAVKDLENAETLTVTIKADDKDVAGTATVTAPYEWDEKGVILAGTVDAEGNITNVPVSFKDGNIELETAANEAVVVWTVPAEKAFVLTIDEKDADVFGEKATNDVAPKIVKDRTMLPARFVAEKLGATVEWNGEKQEVTVKSDDVTIVITIGAETALVNDKEVKLDAPAFIENDRTYTPIRFISENLGATVNWNGATEQVVITK